MRERTNNDLCTPAAILDPLRRWFQVIKLDPCSNQWSSVRADVELDGEEGRDGIRADWLDLAQGSLAFVNPPYGRGCLPRWAAKMATEAARGCEIIALLPCSPDTRWWRDVAAAAQVIVYIHGRISFGGGEHGAGTFPSALLYLGGERPYLFAHAFAHLGDVRCCR